MCYIISYKHYENNKAVWGQYKWTDTFQNGIVLESQTWNCNWQYKQYFHKLIRDWDTLKEKERKP